MLRLLRPLTGKSPCFYAVIVTLLILDLEPRHIRAEEPWFLGAAKLLEYSMYDPSVSVMTSDRFGNVYFSGTTWVSGSTGRGAYSFWFMCFDRNGHWAWSGQPTTSVADIWASDMTLDSRSNLFIAGSSRGPAMYLQKAGPDGGWTRQAWGAPGSVYAAALAVDAAGNSYVTGDFSGAPPNFLKTSLTNSDGPDNYLVGNGGTDGFLVKYDPKGTILWLKNFGGTNDDLGEGIGVDAETNCYVSGVVTGPATVESVTIPNSGGFLAKYNQNGAVLWARNVDRGELKVDPAGNCYVGGAGGLAKYNSKGGTLWAITNAADKIALSRDNLFAMTGTVVQKYTLGGELLWSIDMSSPLMTADYWGNVYAGGIFIRQATVADTTLMTRWASLYMARLGSDTLRLRIANSGTQPTASWSTNATGFSLKTSTNFSQKVWATVRATPAIEGSHYTVRLPNTGTARFYRLEGN